MTHHLTFSVTGAWSELACYTAGTVVNLYVMSAVHLHNGMQKDSHMTCPRFSGVGGGGDTSAAEIRGGGRLGSGGGIGSGIDKIFPLFLSFFLTFAIIFKKSFN